MNVSYDVLKYNNKSYKTEDVCHDGEWDQGTKVPDEGQQDYWKKNYCNPSFNVQSVGYLKRRRRGTWSFISNERWEGWGEGFAERNH